MFTLSAFADEISPDPREQVAVLRSCGVRHIEFRSIHKTNVLALSDEQVREFKKLLDGEGFKLHLDKFKRAAELCGVFGTPNIRVFSYYPPADKPFAGDWSPYRDEVIRRMRAKAELAAKERVKLFHENEH